MLAQIDAPGTMNLAADRCALQHSSRFGLDPFSARTSNSRREAVMQLAVKLNVLATFAVFVFVGAILMGIF